MQRGAVGSWEQSSQTLDGACQTCVSARSIVVLRTEVRLAIQLRLPFHDHWQTPGRRGWMKKPLTKVKGSPHSAKVANESGPSGWTSGGTVRFWVEIRRPVTSEEGDEGSSNPKDWLCIGELKRQAAGCQLLGWILYGLDWWLVLLHVELRACIKIFESDKLVRPNSGPARLGYV